MGTLYITEYYSGSSAGIPVVRKPALVTQTVGIGAGSLQSAAFGGDTKLIRVHTDAICSVAFGTNPVATTSDARMAANQTEYWEVVPGLKLAVISNV